jgi:hypothetical protein
MCGGIAIGKPDQDRRALGHHLTAREDERRDLAVIASDVP